MRKHVSLTQSEEAQIGRLKSGHMSSSEIRRLALQTSSNAIRNVAVITLADMHAPEAADTILELLKRAETKGSRGSILFALSETKAPAPLPLLVRMLREEVYEGQEEALRLIDHHQFTATPIERANALKTLAAMKTTKDDDVRELAGTAISYLTR